MFSEIGVKQMQADACDAFGRFGETHRLIERRGIEMIRNVKPVTITAAFPAVKPVIH